jgi:hypothetical protein
LEGFPQFQQKSVSGMSVDPQKLHKAAWTGSPGGDKGRVSARVSSSTGAGFLPQRGQNAAVFGISAPQYWQRIFTSFSCIMGWFSFPS